jgi:hypothetical protein
MFFCWLFYLFISINPFALVNLFTSMVYKKVLLVFFFTLHVIFSEPFCFNALICFNEPFYNYASVNFNTSVNFFALVVQCGALRFYASLLFYFVFFTLFSMSQYVLIPLLASMRFFSFIPQ